MCQGFGPLDAGDPESLVSCLMSSPPGDEVHDGLVEVFPRGGEVPEGLDREGLPALL